MKKHEYTAAILVAAGNSSRMVNQNKLFLKLNDTPVVICSLLSLQHANSISEIVIAARYNFINELTRLAAEYNITKLTKIVCGGKTRADSVAEGIKAVSPNAALIAVHDGARPFASSALIDSVVFKAEETGAAVPVIPISDTVKHAEQGVILSTEDRTKLYLAQTPQVFKTNILKRAIQNAAELGIPCTDDASAAELLGVPVYTVPGERFNLKITVPEDYILACALVQLEDLL